jgi:hypothetical protein
MASTSSAAASGPLSALPPDLYELLDGPAIMYIATRNAALEPLSTLAFGLQAADDDRELTVFVPAVLSPLVVANLRDNGQMAIELVHPSTHRALQIKGTWLGERRTTDDDRAFLARYHNTLLAEMNLVGIPRSKWDRLVWWPAVALRMEVRDVFVQTPGPGAGRRAGDPGGASSADRQGKP